MIYSKKDPFNDADRYDVMINPKDAEALYMKNAAVYWPEGNVLIPKGMYESHAKIPEYNTEVIIEKAETFHSRKDQRYVEKRIKELEVTIE